MIKRLIVKGLNGKHDFDLTFNPDLNIFTGRNGSGKTTLLKLIWYLISGNGKLIIEEINFEYLKLELEEYGGSSIREINKKENEIIYTVSLNGGNPAQEHIKLSEYKHIGSELNHIASINSLFFPTFRLIEGGFGFMEAKDIDNLNTSFSENFLEKLSKNLFLRHSFLFEHNFITTISTVNIKELLTRQYAYISEDIRRIEDLQNEFILSRVESSNNQEKEVLLEIKGKVEETDKNKIELLKPFTVLSDLTKLFLKDKGISITKNLSLGETKELISSDKLSAGEKQILSFLAYNAFSENTAIFIDEPEISLHTDWQRILFPTLLSQGTNNQFFIATHSPFIYSKYPDKDICLDDENDKGGE